MDIWRRLRRREMSAHMLSIFIWRRLRRREMHLTKSSMKFVGILSFGIVLEPRYIFRAGPLDQ